MRVSEIAVLLKRHAVSIVVAACAGGVLAYAYAATLPRLYTAAASVAVEGDRLAIPELQGALRADNSPDPMPFVRTEVQALSARQVIVRLIGELDLARNPEFNGALRPPTLLGSAIRWLKSWLPSPASPAAHADGPDDTVVNAVSRALAVGHDNRSLVITVAFTARSPTLAATAVNRLIADYMEERSNRRQNADRSANAAISGRIDQVRGEIERIENDMKKLRADSGVIALRAGSLGQQQVEELSTEATRAAAQRSEIQSQLARAQAASSSGSTDALAAVLGSETTSRLRQAEAEAAARAASLAARFGPNYPPLVSAQADLGATRAQLAQEARRIVASLSTQLAVASAHEADVQRQLTVARREGAAAQDVQARLQQMQQDVATRRTLYATLLEREQQTLSQPRGGTLPDIRVLSHAGTPTLPSAPNMKMAALFGGAAGGLLAAVVAFTVSPRHRRFTGLGEIERMTGTRLGGTVPLQNRDLRGLPALVAADPGGPGARALRDVLGRLPANARGGGQVVTIAALHSDTANLLAAALGRAAALDGMMVLLIDLPLPNRGVGKLLDSPAGTLEPVLAGNTEWHAALRRDNASPLEMLLANSGQTIPELAVALENLLAELRQEFNLIVLVATGVRDAALRAADSALLVIDLPHDGAEATSELARAVARHTRATPQALVLTAA